jgi:uncharacterized repeat protein (TIGR03806 family)
VEAFPAAPAFLEPVKLLQPPGDATQWFVLEKAGRIKRLNVANPAGAAVWLDLTNAVDPAGEGGLLGLAFHPAYPATPEIYVSYTAPGLPLTSILSRFILDNVNTPQAATEQILLTVDQPADNHNGGDIAFGPDGYLYFGLGDGGGGDDIDQHAQNNTDLLGAMLRIDVVGVPFSERYGIPPGNPFAANPKCGPAGNAQACPEIYAWGFRNPWRWSFDRQTGTLWLGDVGQGAWEEVDVVERGGNYGWRCREGAHDLFPADCPAGGLIDPVVDYGRDIGTTVTGGFVYRGTAMPSRHGQYVFGDFSAGWVAVLGDDGNGGLVRQEVFNGYSIATFGQDQAGEIYFADFNDGRIRKLVPAGGAPTDTIAENLADTGCVNAASPAQAATGLVPYDINAPLWSDGAAKERWMALPDGTTISIDAAGDWIFPTGSVLMKNFRLNGRLVETRLLMRHPDGVWGGYTYEWNDAQTAAIRVRGGKTRQVEGQAWIYPAENQCRQCHTQAAGFSLGPETAQLNRIFLYPATGKTANQLTTLEHIGMLSAPLPGPASTLPRLANPADAAQVVHARARAWLHTNCAQCHRPSGPTPVAMDLRNATALQDMQICNIGPSAGDLGIVNARIVGPADAKHSVLSARAGRRDSNGMPPLASNLVDAQGVALLNTWINGLGSCTDTDSDQADDARDNCVTIANTDQRDTNDDGFGNACDADLNNSGGLVNFADLAVFRAAFGTSNADADFNGSGGLVNFGDIAIFRSLFGKPPGPAAP